MKERLIYANNQDGWGLFGLLMVFLIMLEVGYLYLYRKGALDWDR